MNEIITILNTPVFSILEQTFTVGKLIAAPTAVLIGVILIKWLARLIVRKLIKQEANPDVVHLIKRIFLIANNLLVSLNFNVCLIFIV